MSLFSAKGSHQSPHSQSNPEKITAGEHPSSPKKGKVMRILGIAAGALILLMILGIVVFSIWSKPPEVEDTGLAVQTTSTPVPLSSASASPSVSPKATAEPETAKRLEDVYTLLVVGRDKVGMNTDTILMVRMDCADHTANVVSIPRDTLVNVPWAVKKVNSIYGSTGIEGLLSGVEDLVGFAVDNYVVVNTYVFQSIVDAIGGVWFDVPVYMYYDDPDQDLHIAINAGYQWLDGAHAEQVVRFRQNNDGSGYPDGDLGRIETQQAFFKTMAKQVLSAGNISNLSSLIDIVLNNTDTDLTNANLAFYAEEFLKMYGDGITFLTMPHENVYIQGGSYVSIVLDEWLDMINTSLNPYDTEVSEINLDVLTYSDAAGLSSTTGEAPSLDTFYNYYG